MAIRRGNDSQARQNEARPPTTKETKETIGCCPWVKHSLHRGRQGMEHNSIHGSGTQHHSVSGPVLCGYVCHTSSTTAGYHERHDSPGRSSKRTAPIGLCEAARMRKTELIDSSATTWHAMRTMLQSDSNAQLNARPNSNGAKTQYPHLIKTMH